MRTLDCFRPKDAVDMNDMLNPNTVVEATRLTYAGRLTEATALLQRMLRGEDAPDVTFGAAGDIAPPRPEPPTIDMTAAVDKTDRSPSSRFGIDGRPAGRSEEHTSELQSLTNLVCRLLLEKKKKQST